MRRWSWMWPRVIRLSLILSIKLSQSSWKSWIPTETKRITHFKTLWFISFWAPTTTKRSIWCISLIHCMPEISRKTTSSPDSFTNSWLMNLCHLMKMKFKIKWPRLTHLLNRQKTTKLTWENFCDNWFSTIWELSRNTIAK